jgi:hypothetical protein
MCRAFLRFSDVANLIVFATWRLGPLLRSVQDTGDLNRFLSDAVNNDERQAGDNHLSRVGLAAWSATVRHLVQRGGAFIDRVCHTAGLRRAKTFCGVIADMQKIIRSGLRPANEH